MKVICRKAPEKLLKADEVRELLALHCKAIGGQTAFARRCGVTRAYVSSVLLGRNPPSRKVCEALGLREDGMRWIRK